MHFDVLSHIGCTKHGKKTLLSILLTNKLFYLFNSLANKQWFINIRIHMLFTLAALYNFFLESFNQIKQNMA